MKKILTLLLVYVLTPFIARGQEDATYSINEGNVHITGIGTYTITGTGEVTGNNIHVKASGTVNITIENVNIESGSAPLNIEPGGDVKLTLRGTNRLIAHPTGSWNKAGIRVPKGASLEITEESEGHSLTAKGSENFWGGAGIGANMNEIAGAITIHGGNLDITGGHAASAIGGGTTYKTPEMTLDITPDATFITINGGVIIAQSIGSDFPVAIGGGIGGGVGIKSVYGNGGIIKITGGTVIANGVIGHVGDGSTESITITGGNIAASCAITPKNESGTNLVKKEIFGLASYAKVTALSGAEDYLTNDMYVDGGGKLHLWLPSDANPSVQAYIAPIKLTVNKDGAAWDEHEKTFSYQTADGEVLTATAFDNFYPENDKEYTVYDGENATNVVVSKDNNFTATLNYYTVTYDENGFTAGTVPTDDGIYLSGSEVTLAEQGDLEKTYYTFKGWGATADATEPIGTPFNIDEKTTLYALWTPNTFTLTEGEIPEFTYDTAIENIDLSEWLSDGATTNCGKITFSLKEGSSLPAGLTLSEEGILSGTPTAANENGVQVTIVATAENGSTAEIVITITVSQAALPEGLLTINKAAQTIEFDGTATTTTLTATVTGDNLGDNPTWTWESDNEKVATVAATDTPEGSSLRSAETRQSVATVTVLGTGTAVITATYTDSHYTGTVTFTLTVEAKEEEPDPTPQPDPDPIYYNIYLDDVCEGVDASLSKGVVKEGSQVSVYVEVEEGYDAENLKVLFKRSLYGYWEEVEEGVQPGEYIIYNVYNDIYVKVEGVEKVEEEPTGMSDIEGTKVYAQNGSLYVYTSQPQEVAIITMNGTVIRRERQEGLRSYSLPKGVYIICIGEEKFKLRI